MSKPIEPCYRMFGARVEMIRKVMGLTQEELSQKVEMSRVSIVNIEAGRQRVLMHEVETFAGAFGITPRQFLKGIYL